MHFLPRGATFLVLLAVAGCAGPPAGTVSRGQNPAPTSAVPTAVLTTAPLATPAPSPRPSCRSERPAGTVVLALPRGRRALLAVPAGDDGHHRLPLVIALPGYGQTSEELAAQSRIPARAMVAGVLAVLPQGADPAKSWNFSGTTGHDDVAFLSALVTQLAAHPRTYRRRDHYHCPEPARHGAGGEAGHFTTVAYPGDHDVGRIGAFSGCQLGDQCGQKRHIVMAGGTGEVPGLGGVRTLWQHGKHACVHGAGRDSALGRQLLRCLAVSGQRNDQGQPVVTVIPGRDGQQCPTSARQRENHRAGGALAATAGPRARCRGGERCGRQDGRRNCRSGRRVLPARDRAGRGPGAARDGQQHQERGSAWQKVHRPSIPWQLSVCVAADQRPDPMSWGPSFQRRLGSPERVRRGASQTMSSADRGTLLWWLSLIHI